MKQSVIIFCAAAVVSACGNSQSGDKHELKGPPHGGTPVAVGHYKDNLELVRDGDKGVLQAYVLNAHFDKFVAVPETIFVLIAKFAGSEKKANFERMPSTPPSSDGSSYLFETRAQWIRSATNFQGLIPTITLQGRTYTNIAFPFPEGVVEQGH